MKVNFSEIAEKTIPEFKGGSGALNTRMFTDPLIKIMKARLEPGSSIGLHTHDTSCEVIFILEGNGKCLYEDSVETVTAGDCHYCPKGRKHTLINDSDADLVFYAVVPEQ